MKRVYIASDPIDAELVAGLLMASGISAVVRNDHLWPIAGLSMTLGGAPAVWVTDDSDEERARNLIAETRNPKSESPAPWICETCTQENDGPFGLCWKCGRLAPPLE